MPLHEPMYTTTSASEHLVFLDCPADVAEALLAAQKDWFQESDAPGKENLKVVCTGSLKDPRLCKYREDVCPILLVGIIGPQVTIGPLQIPGESVCLECLQYWAATAGWSQITAMPPGVAGTAVVGLAVQVATESISEFKRMGTVSALERYLTAIDVATNTSTRHPIFPRASCPACSKLPKRTSTDLSVHCSPLTGIVRRLKYFDEPIVGVYQAGGRLTGPLPAPGTERSLGYATSWGRGMSLAQARDSCIGEALEFYSAAYRGNEKLTRGTLAEMPNAIDPRSIVLYSQAQYRQQGHSGDIPGDRHAIAEKFGPDQAVDWMEGTDLIEGKVIWVPAACCLTGYKFGANEQKFALADRSGLATGISYWDALASAILELIEHDSVAIWWYNRIKRPAIRLESFGCPALVTVSEALKKIGRRLWLLDLTTDLQIPSYTAISATNEGKELIFGAASHPSPRIAAEKAVTEVPHLWLSMQIAKMPLDFTSWRRTAVLSNQKYFEPEGIIDSPAEPGPLESRQIVDLCVQRMKERGIQPIAVDLTRPDVLVHAVRAIAPGMRSPRNQRGPGRLYTVPVQLGWLQKALTESELNPINCVL